MVKWTSVARRDLKRTHDYIAEDSKFYAKKVVNDILSKSITLKDFTEIGRVVPELDDATIRELFVYSYRLIYQVETNRVTILTIIHGKRDFLKIFQNPK